MMPKAVELEPLIDRGVRWLVTTFTSDDRHANVPVVWEFVDRRGAERMAARRKLKVVRREVRDA